MPIICKCDRCGDTGETVVRRNHPDNLILCDDCQKVFETRTTSLGVRAAAEYKAY